MASPPSIIDLFSQATDLRNRMADPSDNGAQAVAGRAVCNVYGSNPQVIAAGTLATSPGLTGALDYTCGRYFEENGFDGPTRSAGFSGGQCNVDYIVTVTGLFTFSSSTCAAPQNPNPRIFRGPIRGLEGLNPGRNTFCNLDAFTGYDILHSDAAGNPVRSRLVGSLSGAPQYYDYVIVNVERADGEPDDCGDLPAPLEPGANPPPSTPIGSPVDVPLFGEDTPVVIRLPDDPLTGTPGITVETPFGDVNIDIGNDNRPDGGEGLSPGAPVVGAPEDVIGTEGEVEAPPGSNGIGYAWELLGAPSELLSVPGSNPDIYPRIVGNLRLLTTESGEGQIVSRQLTIRSQGGTLYSDSPYVRVVGARFNLSPEFSGMRLTLIEVPEE